MYIVIDKDPVRCCQEMFTKWLQTQENASWDQLLEALRSPSVQLKNLANQIDQMILGECIFLTLQLANCSLSFKKSNMQFT